MRRIPNGTWVAVLIAAGIGLSIVYAVLGGDEPLYDRNRDKAPATATVAPTPKP